MFFPLCSCLLFCMLIIGKGDARARGHPAGAIKCARQGRSTLWEGRQKIDPIIRNFAVHFSPRSHARSKACAKLLYVKKAQVGQVSSPLGCGNKTDQQLSCAFDSCPNSVAASTMQDIPTILATTCTADEAKTDSTEMTTSIQGSLNYPHLPDGHCDHKNGGSPGHKCRDDHPHYTHVTSGKTKPSLDKLAVRRLVMAASMCLVFMVGEIIGGYLAGSLAIATDAAHLMTDLVSFLISLVALKLASKSPSGRLTFGWHRAEVLGALVSVLLIWVVTAVLVYMAVERIVSNDYQIEGGIMLIIAGIGVVMNIVMGVVLSVGGVPHGHTHGSAGHGHAHGSGEHGHSHGDKRKAQGTKNINVRAALIHVIGDILQSVGVLVAALIVYFKPTWKIVDPICTFVFSILVLITTITILKDTLVVLMEGLPIEKRLESVRKSILGVPGVNGIRKVRMWALTMDKEVVMATIVIKPTSDASNVLKQICKVLNSLDHVFDYSIQIETFEAGEEIPYTTTESV